MEKLKNLLSRRLSGRPRSLINLIFFLIERIEQDRLTVIAGYLTYVTLLSLVPLVAVIFGAMSAFPVFKELKNAFETLIYQNLVPTAGDVLRENINAFVANATNTTAVGIGSLVVVALLLIHAIDKNLNFIWRNHNHRPLGQAFAVYWMILTLGPLLIGASLALSSYLLSLQIFDPSALFGVMDWLLRIVPLLLSILTFWLIYAVVPCSKVRFIPSISGAIVAALLFEAAKKGFALYITLFPTYQSIYGALATIPITFVWVYLSWLVILFGAEITAALGEYSEHDPLKNPSLID